MNSQELVAQANIWPAVCQGLANKYTVLDAYAISKYDNNIVALADSLQKYRSHVFLEQERLVFSQYDIEYYYLDSTIGFTLANLISILYTLDISFAHCILFTNNYGIADQVKKLCQRYGSDFTIKVHENSFGCGLAVREIPEIPKIRTAQDIKYHFCFLSYVRRDHRSYVRCYLEDQNLVDKTLLSWNHTLHSASNNKNNQLDHSITEFVTTTPYAHIRDKIIPTVKLAKIYSKNANCLDAFYRNPLIPSGGGPGSYHADFIRHSFLNLVAESVFDYPYPYLSEKTFKCVWELTPFIIIGAPRSLQQLKILGFQTFDQWIDESYDQIDHPAQRLEAIFDVIDTVSNWSLDHCQEVYNQMSSTLNHNYQHYRNHFCQTLITETIESL
jgi:hypothetical protein